METVWPGTAKQPGWPFSNPGQTCGPSQHPSPNSTTELPQDMHCSTQWIHGPPFLRVTPGKWQLKKFNNSFTRPCCQGKCSWTFTLTPFMQFLSLFTGTPHQNLLGTTQAGLPWAGAEEAECGGNLFLGACIIPPVNACIWPALLGLLYRAVDTVQSALLSVPDKMAIKDWVRGQAPKAISTPKWLIIIMCGLNQEPVMSCIH